MSAAPGPPGGEGNNILAAHLEQLAKSAGTPGRIALPIAGYEVAAKRNVMALVEELGFDAVDGGSLHESWRQQPSGPIYCNDLPGADLKEHLSSLGTERTEAQHTQFLANQAEQEKQMKAQGIKLK